MIIWKSLLWTRGKFLSDGYTPFLPEVSAQEDQFSSWITRKLKTTFKDEDQVMFHNKHKTFAAFLPYALLRERDREQEVFDALRSVVRAAVHRRGSLWTASFAGAISSEVLQRFL